MRKPEFEIDILALHNLVPTVQAARGIFHIVVAKPHVDGVKRRHLLDEDLVVPDHLNVIGVLLKLMVVIEPVFHVTAFDARVEGVGGVCRHFVSEQVKRQRIMQVQLFLNGRQIDDAEIADAVHVIGIGDAGRGHGIHCRLDGATDTRLAHEHVVCFLGQHETTGTAQRVEPGLRKAFKLHLAVTVGEVGEHEEGQPVRRLFIEGPKHARRFIGAGTPLQKQVRLLTPVGAEIFLKQVDHRPEMAALLDIDLEQVAHVIERRGGQTKETLLLDRPRLGITLDHDQAAQHGAVFAGNFLPRHFAGMLTARYTPILDLRREKDAPPVFRHLHIVELGPSAGLDPDCRAKIDFGILELLRNQPGPPVDIARVPFLECLQDPAVRGQVDVVRNLRVVTDIHHILHRSHLVNQPRRQTRSILYLPRTPVP